MVNSISEVTRRSIIDHITIFGIAWSGRLQEDEFLGRRVYYKQFGELLVILLAGGDKQTQDKDIRIALRLARDL